MCIRDSSDLEEGQSLGEKLSIAASVYMGMTRSAIGPVHMLAEQSADPTANPDGKVSMRCGKRILERNLEHGDSLSIQAQMGPRGWCINCQQHWPSELHQALL